ncbi:iron-sulfur cluster co-chaperone HscB C-terminal domain-containing protein [Adhaeribacter aquaticus]|uniref:iron-sulfur cluster co-chaperone HscB C-terminal domain-containing protein n=1 Tax=Adhaeribacter aquaticus TaxID=299567 RepID=UPI00042552BA|nr:iron-sulfur cluster co-chaperone HscB C-terminal domain-containing protein [Adhaeribacter aquaticus]
MNYFEFYGLQEGFLLDEKQVKNKYDELTRQYHLDSYVTESPEKQQEIQALSTQNTNAYHTLSNPDLRTQYILQHYGLLEEGENQDLPEDFLKQMKELNEQIKELESSFDKASFEKVSQQVIGNSAALEADIQPVFQQYPILEGFTKDEALQQVETYYLKKKYLLRIQESLSKFATQSS